MTRHMLKMLAILVLLLLVTTTVSATVRTDDNGQVPFYARISRGEIHNNGRWGVVVF